MNILKLSEVKFKQTDIPRQYWTRKEDGTVKNEHCYNVSLFVMAANVAEVYQPTLADFIPAFKEAMNKNLVGADGYVKDYEALPTLYAHYFGFPKIKRFKVTGWNHPDKTWFTGDGDYLLLNVKTQRGGGHFLLSHYDPWPGGTDWQHIKSVKYFNIVQG